MCVFDRKTKQVSSGRPGGLVVSALSFRGCLWTKEQKTERSLGLPGICCFGLEGEAGDAPWVDTLEVLRTGNPWSCPPAGGMQMAVTGSGLGVRPGL